MVEPLLPNTNSGSVVATKNFLIEKPTLSDLRIEQRTLFSALGQETTKTVGLYSVICRSRESFKRDTTSLVTTGGTWRGFLVS